MVSGELRKKIPSIRVMRKKDREKESHLKALETGKLPGPGEPRGIALDRVGDRQKARVLDIQGGWGIKRRLSQMGIHPGDTITVVRYGPLGGPMVIEVHGFQLALGRGIASRILVEEVEP